MSDNERVRVRAEALEVFCQRVLQGVGISEEDARIAAEVLVTANLRGSTATASLACAHFMSTIFERA